jgi:hypothetical protein
METVTNKSIQQLMIRYCLISLIFCIHSGFLSGQVYLPRKAYFHLAGRIDDRMDVTLNLVKVLDSLYADLIFSESECTHSVLSGLVDRDGKFQMRNPYCDTGMVFQGSFITRQKLTGTYINPGKSQSERPFVFVESYPAGSIPMQVFYQDSIHSLVSGTGSPVAEIRQCMILPGESSNPVISDTIRSRMVQDFTGKALPAGSPEQILPLMERAFLENYQTTNSSLYKSFPDAGILNWELLRFTHVLYNDNHILTYYILSYAFTGGAHGLETQDFRVVDITTGRALTLSDLFLPGFETGLSQLLTSKLKEQNKMPETARLSDNGFFVDEVKPNTNFYITNRGIGFYYNHYELAPYANGPSDIFLTFEELLSLIREVFH